jgi:hypothetical protein
MPKKDFFDRVNERFDDFDSGSRQAFLLRLVRDRGFFEAVFNAVYHLDSGIDQKVTLVSLFLGNNEFSRRVCRNSEHSSSVVLCAETVGNETPFIEDGIFVKVCAVIFCL